MEETTVFSTSHYLDSNRSSGSAFILDDLILANGDKRSGQQQIDNSIVKRRVVNLRISHLGRCASKKSRPPRS